VTSTARPLAFLALVVALFACATISQAATLSPRAKVEALLLERDFDALSDALRKPPPSPSDAERLFTLALTMLDTEAFYRLYDVAPDAMKREAMTAAVQHGRVDLLDGLVKRGWDPNDARGWRGSFVMTAARSGNIRVIEWALKSGVRALPENGPENELAAASYALAAARPPSKETYAASAFRWLEARGFQPATHPDAVAELTGNLLRYGDLALVDRYVRLFKAQNVFDPNAKRRGIPLVYSALTVPALEYLEAQGAKIDVPSVDEPAVTMRALSSQMANMAALRGRFSFPNLLDTVMDPPYRANPLENRDLDRAARFYLLSKGLPPRGDALLHVLGATPADLELVEALLKAGADPNWRPDGRCGAALHCVAKATASGRLDGDTARKLIALLVRSGADLRQVTTFGGTPVRHAAMTCDWKALKVWLDAEHDANVSSSVHTILASHTLNVQSCDKPTPDVIRELTRAGADPNAGVTPPLHTLASARLAVPMEIYDALLDAGADVNRGDGAGNTALRPLVTLGLRQKAPCRPAQQEARSCADETLQERARLIRHLVSRGADPSRPNKTGESTLDAARKLPDEEKRQSYVSALSAPAR